MRVHSYTTDESSLENKAPDPNNSATRGYPLTAFSVPLLPGPHVFTLDPLRATAERPSCILLDLISVS